MEYREILVTLISAQNLKKVNAFGRHGIYGVVWIYPNRKVSSPVASAGNLNPTWDTTLTLTADERLVQTGNAVLNIDLYNYGSFGNTRVGSTSIRLSGLRATVVGTTTVVDEERVEDKVGSSSTSPSIMTVPVFRRSGRARGTLNVSVRLGELIKYPEYPPPAVAGQDGPVHAYPPGHGYGHGHYPGAAKPYPMTPYYPYGGYASPPRSGVGTGLLAGGLGGLLLGALLGGGCGGF